MSEKKIIAYKGFDKDLKCRDFQYKIGKKYIHKGDVEPCESGFHACQYPLGVFHYYAPAESRFAEVEASGEIVPHEDQICCEKIKIKTELTLGALIQAAVKFTFDRVKWTKENHVEKEKEAASAAGDYGAASATGFRGAASATGDYGAASATGFRGAASATGLRLRATMARLRLRAAVARLRLRASVARLRLRATMARLRLRASVARLRLRGYGRLWRGFGCGRRKRGLRSWICLQSQRGKRVLAGVGGTQWRWGYFGCKSRQGGRQKDKSRYVLHSQKRQI